MKLVVHKNGKTYLLIDGKYAIKNQSIPSHGYPAVWFRSKSNLVHRLVARAYLPNIKNKKEVNHKNGIKIDNRAQNLEWVTPSENIQHSYDKLNRRSNLNAGMGSVYWDNYGKGRWVARFHCNHKVLVKASKNKEICDQWIEEKRNGL